MSRVSNHINRNIDQDRSSIDADIEILNINSPDYNTQDTEQQHDKSLNEAWRFINAARHQNFTKNDISINSTNHKHLRIHDRHEFTCESTREKNNNPPNKNSTFSRNETSKTRKYGFRFSNINDYLDAIDNSSDEDSPNIIQRNYFNTEDASEEAVEVFDGTLYTVANEGPLLIYSYKNKNYTYSAKENLINSPNEDSQSNSTSSISVDNLNEESLSYEKSFCRISTSYHPIIIPRLPLTTYILPTVTEIMEPSRQSAKVTELSDEDVGSLKQKPSNSWVMNHEDSSQSDANNTTETNVDISADELSPNKNEQSLDLRNNTTTMFLANDSNIHEMKENDKNSDSNDLFDNNFKELKVTSSRSTDGPTRSTYYVKEIIKQGNSNSISSDVTQRDSRVKEHIEKDNIQTRHSESSDAIEVFTVHNSIPSLHLSISTDANINKQSWVRRFITCILCCK